jgi:hypothetical protein
MGGIAAWMKANRWFVAILLVIVGGYLIGKDLALRGNVSDRAAERSAR